MLPPNPYGHTPSPGAAHQSTTHLRREFRRFNALSVLPNSPHPPKCVTTQPTTHHHRIISVLKTTPRTPGRAGLVHTRSHTPQNTGGAHTKKESVRTTHNHPNLPHNPTPMGIPQTTKKKGSHAPHAHSQSFNAGSDLLSHTLPGAVPSAQVSLASGFGKGPGVILTANNHRQTIIEQTNTPNTHTKKRGC